jgi:hypothetical protein
MLLMLLLLHCVHSHRRDHHSCYAVRCSSIGTCCRAVCICRLAGRRPLLICIRRC